MTNGVRLAAAASSLRLSGLVWLAAAVLGTIVVLSVFDWPVREVVDGGLIGAVLWAADVARRGAAPVPRAAALPLAPTDAHIQRRVPPTARLLLLVPLVVGMAWLADWWDLGALFVPGMMAGTAAMQLAGAELVRRWERAHGQRVIVGQDGSGDPELYALALPDTRDRRATRL